MSCALKVMLPLATVSAPWRLLKTASDGMPLSTRETAGGLGSTSPGATAMLIGIGWSSLPLASCSVRTGASGWTTTLISPTGAEVMTGWPFTKSLR